MPSSVPVEQGIQGQILPLPALAQQSSSDSSEAFNPVILVRWSIGLPSGLYFLLGSISGNVSHLQKVNSTFFHLKSCNYEENSTYILLEVAAKDISSTGPQLPGTVPKVWQQGPEREAAPLTVL